MPSLPTVLGISYATLCGQLPQHQRGASDGILLSDIRQDNILHNDAANGVNSFVDNKEDLNSADGMK